MHVLSRIKPIRGKGGGGTATEPGKLAQPTDDFIHGGPERPKPRTADQFVRRRYFGQQLDMAGDVGGGICSA